MNLEQKSETGESEKYLELNITYNIKENTFETSGNLKPEAQKEIVENYVRAQIGQGRDNREPNILDIYHIQLRWYPENDNMEINSNAGNASLTTGILMNFLSKR